MSKMPRKFKTRQHPIDVDDATLETFDAALNAAEEHLAHLLPHMSPEEIADRFATHARIHLETELTGAKKYHNNPRAFRDAVNSGRESAF